MLKSTIILLALLNSTHIFASMRDGCFAMFQGSSTNGALCISGTNEEGIGGRGIRFMFFASGQAKWCGTNTKLQMRYSQDGSSVAKFSFPPAAGIKYFLVTFPSYKERGTAKGKIRMGGSQKTDFDYIQLSRDTIKNAGVAKAWTSPKCRAGLSKTLSASAAYSSAGNGWLTPQEVLAKGAIPIGVNVTFALKNGTTVSGQMMPVLSRGSFSIKSNGVLKRFEIKTIKAVKFN